MNIDEAIKDAEDAQRLSQQAGITMHHLLRQHVVLLKFVQAWDEWNNEGRVYELAPLLKARAAVAETLG